MRLVAILKAENMSGAERLMDYWQRWLDTQCGDDIEAKCLAVKLGGEVSNLSEAMRLALQRGTNRVVQQLAECIAEGCADGSLTHDLDTANTALVLYNQWLGATVLTKIRRDRSALEAAMILTRQLLKLSPPKA